MRGLTNEKMELETFRNKVLKLKEITKKVQKSKRVSKAHWDSLQRALANKKSGPLAPVNNRRSLIKHLHGNITNNNLNQRERHLQMVMQANAKLRKAYGMKSSNAINQNRKSKINNALRFAKNRGFRK